MIIIIWILFILRQLFMSSCTVFIKFISCPLNGFHMRAAILAINDFGRRSDGSLKWVFYLIAPTYTQTTFLYFRIINWQVALPATSVTCCAKKKTEKSLHHEFVCVCVKCERYGQPKNDKMKYWMLFYICWLNEWFFKSAW